jgi:Fur family peroxide stress response transcriptional regulator
MKTVKKIDLELRMDAFKDACKSAGLKLTHQRMEIFRELARSDDHPDAMRIYSRVRRRMPSISFDTVYRTLRTFEEEGMISMVGVWGDRQKFDAKSDKHHHFVCVECGAILDMSDPEIDNLAIPREAFKVGVPRSLHVEVRGRCAKCAEKGCSRKLE